MPECCDRDSYGTVFNRRFARRTSRRYQRNGPTPAAQAIADFVSSKGIEGATVLEIGGGVGHLHVDLLRRGAAHVTNLEISESYEAEAGRLLAETGLSDRVTRRFVDIAKEPDVVEPADVVVMHRVVCCYPDFETLLGVAAQHARRTLAYSHPANNAINRVVFGGENAYRWMRRSDFRAFVHPPEEMVRAAQVDGMAVGLRHHARDWDVVGLSRTAPRGDGCES